MFFNHIVTLYRFIKNNKLYLEYQGAFARILWLRNKLRYGKNFQDEGFNSINKIINPEMGNPQPSS